MKYHFGEKIRKVREKKKYTMKEIAEKAGVSESLVSQIERNKVSPAIDTLMRIIEVLDIEIDYLFSDYRKARSVRIIKQDERNKILSRGVLFEQLSSTTNIDEEHGIEAYYMEIEPGSEKGSREYGHKGKEMGIILEGTGEFRYGGEIYPITAGDSLSYSSDIPHLLVNCGEAKLKAIWIITPPKMFFKDS